MTYLVREIDRMVSMGRYNGKGVEGGIFIFIQFSLTSVSRADNNTNGMERQLDRTTQSNRKPANPPKKANQKHHPLPRRQLVPFKDNAPRVNKTKTEQSRYITQAGIN
jgi:hypothetical protein